MKQSNIKTGQIINIEGLPIYDRGRLFNQKSTIRIDDVDSITSSANITVLAGSEPGIIGITYSVSISELEQHTVR